MPPPITRTSTRSMTWPSTSSLLDTLAPPITAAVGRLAPPSAALKRLQLGLHQPPGVGRQPLGEAGDRGVGAVRDRERVVDVEVAQRGELVGEGRIALLLAGVEAQVLEQRHAAVRQGIDHGVGELADAVGREADVDAAQRLRQRLDDRRQAHRALGLALGPAEMRQHDDLGTLARQLLERLAGALDPGRVGDLAVLHRHVEVDPHQHPLAPGSTSSSVRNLGIVLPPQPEGAANIDLPGCPLRRWQPQPKQQGVAAGDLDPLDHSTACFGELAAASPRPRADGGRGSGRATPASRLRTSAAGAPCHRSRRCAACRPA